MINLLSAVLNELERTEFIFRFLGADSAKEARSNFFRIVYRVCGAHKKVASVSMRTVLVQVNGVRNCGLGPHPEVSEIDWK